MSNNNEEIVSEEVKNILGYGQVIEMLVGIDEETGKTKIEKFHFTPAPLSKISELFGLIDKISEIDDFTSKEFVDNGANLVKLSIERMHPKVTIEDIKNTFGLVGIMKSIKVVADINDFLSEVREINKLSKDITKMNT
jgi:hypothetical protein